MKTRMGFWIAAMFGLMALALVVTRMRVNDGVAPLAGVVVSAEAKSLIKEISSLRNSAVGRKENSYVYGIVLAGRILSVVDGREREALLAALKESVDGFSPELKPWLRRYDRVDMFCRLVEGIAYRLGTSRPDMSLSVHLAVLKAYVAERKRLRRTLAEVDGGFRKMTSAEWRDFKEYAHKMSVDYFVSLHRLETKLAPVARRKIPKDAWMAFETEFRAIVGRDVLSPESADALEAERVEKLKGVSMFDRWRNLLLGQWK